MNTYEQRFLNTWLSPEMCKKAIMYHFKYYDFNGYPLIRGMLHDVAVLTNDLSTLDLETVVAFADALSPKTQGHYPLSSFSEEVKEIHFVSAILKIWLNSYTSKIEKASPSRRKSIEKLRKNAENTIRYFCLGILAPVPTAVELKIQRQIDMNYGNQWTVESHSETIIRAKTELAFSILHEFGIEYVLKVTGTGPLPQSTDYL